MGLIRRIVICFLSFILFSIISIMQSGRCSANDTLTKFQQLSIGQTLVSAGQIFELGFFSLGNSGKQYVGMWYANVSVRRYVWVANREKPLMVNYNTSSLKIGNDGNLILLDGNQNTVWSTKVSAQSNSTVAVLLDKGNLVLKDNISGLVLWESFNNPTDTLLPTMFMGMNKKTGEKRFLSSWKAEDDPSVGKLVLGLSFDTPPQAFTWIDGSRPYWRSGPWNGWKFIGISDAGEGYSNGINVVADNQQGTVYLMFNIFNSSDVSILTFTPDQSSRIMILVQEMNNWTVTWVAPENPCDVYGACGPFGVCNKKGSPICKCLKGFVPKSNKEWHNRNWTGGCVRNTQLQCGENISGLASNGVKNDGFRKMSGMKLPDHFEYLYNLDASGCQQWCMNNCSCLAYAFPDGIECLVWSADLMDIQQFSSSGEDLFIRLPHSELGQGKTSKKLTIILTPIACLILFSIFSYGMCKFTTNRRVRISKRIKCFDGGDATCNSTETSHENVLKDQLIQSEQSELPMIDFDKLAVATKNFCCQNKLGEGGFGSVYKGKLEDGQEIAVKRLSSHSGQGVEEFKNEIILISKLQHRNLVRLLGCCIGREERLLIYEYMENKSLDTFLFDPKKGLHLDWSKRFNIIQGIARGLLYLHRDSRLRIIHRDLKASNILLDDDLNPKISDFGLARTFQLKQELANTQRIVGTFGYMSPEYAMGGIFSEKSDVFSFGVLLLEIVSSRKNTSFGRHEEYFKLLGYAWTMWNENKGLDLIDEKLVASCSPSQVLRCIQIGLLCVQDHAADRPTMSDIVLMLSSETDLPRPKQPTFTFQRWLDSDLRCQGNKLGCSVNETTMSMTRGR